MVAYQGGAQIEALGDPTRRAIFELVAKGPMAVVDIARALPVSRPAVSQHLKVLKGAELVRDHAEGTRRLYQIDPKGVRAARAYFDRFWTDALDAFKRVAETTYSENEAGKAKERKR